MMSENSSKSARSSLMVLGFLLWILLIQTNDWLNDFPAHKLKLGVYFPCIDDRKDFEYPQLIDDPHPGDDARDIPQMDAVRNVCVRRLPGQVFPSGNRLNRGLRRRISRPVFEHGSVGILSFGCLLNYDPMPEFSDFQSCAMENNFGAM
jgi:hypothetical protein